MPKKAKNLWDKIVDFENFLAAFRTVRRHNKTFDYDLLSFEENIDENIISLINALNWKMWIPGPFTNHIIYEPKKRYMSEPCFSDRVLHEAICRHIVPIFSAGFYEKSFACLVGKGTHRCSKYVTYLLRDSQKHSQGRRVYFLKADISKYYPSINHCILYEEICRKIADKNLLWLLHQIIFESGFDECGLPIGAQTSQLFANVYLNPFDHYVKNKLHVKYYVRYMDDMIFLSYDKKYLHDLKKNLGEWLFDTLKLRWNPKTGVAPASHGIDFSGYRHFCTHTLPRKKNIKRQRRHFQKLSAMYAEGKTDLEHIKSAVSSFVGYMKHCNGRKTAREMLHKLTLRRSK